MQKKKGKATRVLFVILLLLLILVVGMLLVPDTVKAAGIVNFVKSKMYQYSLYDLENYDLDFYVDMSWTWLPWNWTDGIGRSIMYGIYSFTNALWSLSKVMSFGTGEIVSEAYSFDIINELADTIGTNLQKLAGVSKYGFASEGFFPGFLMLIIVVIGVYVAYVGLYKREFSKAISAVVNAVVIFIFSTALIVYAPTCIKALNEFSSEASTQALDLGMGLSMPGTSVEKGGSVDKLRDELFNIQIYQPWLLLQYGTTDTNTIGEERISSLLSVNPEDAYGQTREEVVKKEIETYGNLRMTTTKVMTRFGEVLFIFFINLIISIFVILLSGLMILSQVLFIIYVLFLAISFVLSMFPTNNGLAKKSLLKVFNVILMRAGYVLIATITFSISTMVYSVSAKHSFVVIGILQVIVYAGVFLNMGDILQFMSLQTDRGIAKFGAVGGMVAYQKMRHKEMRRERKMDARMDKAKANIKEKAGQGFHAVKDKGYEMADRRALNYHRQLAADRASETVRKRKDLDYAVAGKTPDAVSADFHSASTGKLYDRYYNRAYGHELGKEKKKYKLVKGGAEMVDAKFYDSVRVESSNKYRRPKLWQRGAAGKFVSEKYYGRVPRSRRERAENRLSQSAMPFEQKKYNVAAKDKVPRIEKQQYLKKNQELQSVQMLGKRAEKLSGAASSLKTSPENMRHEGVALRSRNEALARRTNESAARMSKDDENMGRRTKKNASVEKQVELVDRNIIRRNKDMSSEINSRQDGIYKHKAEKWNRNSVERLREQKSSSRTTIRHGRGKKGNRRG